MQYEFKILELEADFEYVSSPQILIAHTKNDQLKVIIYFMANTALEITGGLARSSMGKVKLQYTAKTTSDAYTASKTLRKVIYTFFNAEGMAKSFEFEGQNLE